MINWLKTLLGFNKQQDQSELAPYKVEPPTLDFNAFSWPFPSSRPTEGEKSNEVKDAVTEAETKTKATRKKRTLVKRDTEVADKPVSKTTTTGKKTSKSSKKAAADTLTPLPPPKPNPRRKKK